MAKYKRKPIVVEASQWKPGIPFGLSNIKEVTYAYKYPSIECKHCKKPLNEHGLLGTLESDNGQQMVCSGDWIITGVAGEKSKCKPDEFEQTYEKV